MITGLIVVFLVFCVFPVFCLGYVCYEDLKAPRVSFVLGKTKLIMQDEKGVAVSVDITNLNHEFFDRYFEKHDVSFGFEREEQ